MSEELFDPEEENKKSKWPYVAIYLIYVLAVGFAEVMFIGMMRSIFENFPPFLMVFAGAGAIAAGLTVAIMPWAKEKWMATDEMNTVSAIFWGLELIVLALNTMLSFDMAKGVTDSWVSWWKHISPASPVLAILTWGILMQMHPKFKKNQGRLKFLAKIDTMLEGKLMKHMASSEMDEYLVDQAKQLADQVLERKFGLMLDATRKRGNGTKRDGNARETTNQPNGHKEEPVRFGTDTTTPGELTDRKNG